MGSRTAGAAFALACTLVAIIAHAGFSDNELDAIYTSMKLKGAIRCGMTVEHLKEKYRGCAESATICDASLITVTEAGPCTDKLVFQNLGGPDPVIMLNGQRFVREVLVPVPQPKPPPSVSH